MARQVLPIVGAVVGGFIGGPAGAQWGYAIGSIVGNAVDPLEVRGPRIGEAGIQTSAEGVFCPIVMGTAAVKGNVITRGNRQVKEQRDSGNKGGPVTITERVYWTFAIRICEGSSTGIAGITRIWEDEKLVYDVRPESTIQAESAEYAKRFRLYLGDETQLPDPDLEAFLGMGNVPSYRGRAYIVFPNFDLTDQQERIPEFRFEVASSATLSKISALMAVGLDPSTNSVIPSQDGKDWSTPAYPHATIPSFVRKILKSDQRYVGYRLGTGPAQKPRYSEDVGETWASSGGGDFIFRGIGGSRGLDIVIPCDGGVAVSHDGGINFSLRSTGHSFGHFAALTDSFALTTNGNDLLLYSTNKGDTWSEGDQIGIDLSAGNAIAASKTEFRYGGRDGTNAAIMRTLSGTISSPMPVPGSATGEVQGIDVGTIKGIETWLAGTQDGWILVDSGFGWQSIPPVGNGSIEEVRFVGTGFIVLYSGASTFTGEVLYTEDGHNFVDVTPNTSGQYTSVASINNIGELTSGKISLSSVVSTLYQRIGIESNLYGVSELTDQLDGVVFAGDYTCADAVRTLMPTYFFDAAEYDDGTGYKLHHVKRGKPVVATITFDDLIDAPEQSVREDSLERPLMLHLHYESPTVGYAPAKATVMRDSPDIKVVGEISIQVPVAFNDPAEPRQIAHKLHKIAWAEVAGEQDFTLGDNWLELVATDTIGLSLRGQVRRLRINQEMIDPGCQVYKLVADRQSAYTSDITGIPLPPPTPPPPSIVGATAFEFLDIPALNDGNDRLLYYDAASGHTEAWYGAQIQRAVPPDTTFTEANTFTQNTIMGVLLDDIPEASEHYPDSTNVVRVQLYTDDEIEALTEQQFLSEGGSFALEKPDGSWEIMQHRDAIDEGDKTFALSFLNRGALNTGASEHTAGARFVLLDGVQSVDAVTAWIGNDLTHRAVSLGTSPDGLPTYTDTYTAKSQTEFPVAHLFAVKNGDTLDLSTVPRHRFGTEDNPLRSINWTGYRWTATDGVNSHSVDTLTADTAIDVTGWSTPITVTVAQINRFTGAGPTVQESVS